MSLVLVSYHEQEARQVRMGLCFTPALWIDVWRSKKAGFNWDSRSIKQVEGQVGYKEARIPSQKQETGSIMIK